ncbi:MAG: DUF2480 family protein [Cyclobacteriaceae bacterium]|nr:DUF2480 family protein [Cyclobacteriaceae bacterium]
MEEIVNRVAKSGIITIDLDNFYDEINQVAFDIKPLLFQEMILKEKDFRSYLKEHDWEQYHDKHVSIYCSSDALIPSWAYMLLAVHLQPYAKSIGYGDKRQLEKQIFLYAIESLPIEEFRGARVVVKGCSKTEVPPEVYIRLTQRLKPLVSNLMYGEPCSTVPVYKEPKIA